MVEYERLEDEVMDAVRAVLNGYQPQLRDHGLECALHPLRRENIGTASYTSEVRVDFKNSKGLVDVLEFHVVREGRPLVTVRDVEGWLREQVEGIVGE